MKKINLIIAVLTIGIISIFGINNKEYSVSNINYTEGNSNLIGKEVNIKGIDGVKFNIIGVDGKKVRLLSQELSESRYFYNSSADGDVPVAFENSAAYSILLNNYSSYKDKMSAVGGDVSIFNLDLPTIEEMASVGKLQKNKTEEYSVTDETPNWILDIYCEDDTEKSYSYSFMTKSISNDGKYIYNLFVRYYSWSNSIYKGADVNTPYTSSPGGADAYGASIRPVLETSATNLISSDADVMAYANSFATNNVQNNNQVNDNNAQIVKVPSTGIDKPFIFTVVGLAVIIISGITIWTLVKTNKSKI